MAPVAKAHHALERTGQIANMASPKINPVAVGRLVLRVEDREAKGDMITAVASDLDIRILEFPIAGPAIKDHGSIPRSPFEDCLIVVVHFGCSTLRYKELLEMLIRV